MRAIEAASGIPISYPRLTSRASTGSSKNVITEAIAATARSSTLPSEIRDALEDSILILLRNWELTL